MTLSLRGHIRSVDIYLAALASTVSGTHTITGRFSYEDGNSKDSTWFTSKWFGQVDTSKAIIPITTHACGNMPVLLYNSQNALIKSALTDSLGYFTFKNIPAGTYKLLGQRNGYASKNEGMVSVGSNSTEIANLKMEAVVTALEDVTDLNNKKVIVYPNPFKDEISIQGYLGEVTVYDLTGKIFHQTMLNKNETIDTQEWPVGFYLLKAGNRTEKIIKTN
ncbi:MAG: T9SS type A sorting domain-containing protein [Cytophagales bacterium]|nr:T9SS type A sorting domain-containing protein [Cytophagales bacterium]